MTDMSKVSLVAAAVLVGVVVLGVVLGATIALGGDVTGGQTDTRVVGLGGQPLDSARPQDGDLIQYDASAGMWAYQPVALASLPAAEPEANYYLGFSDDQTITVDELTETLTASAAATPDCGLPSLTISGTAGSTAYVAVAVPSAQTVRGISFTGATGNLRACSVAPGLDDAWTSGGTLTIGGADYAVLVSTTQASAGARSLWVVLER